MRVPSFIFAITSRQIYTASVSRYAKNAGAVFSLKAHFVWCPKYRRSVLVNTVAKRLEQLLREKAASLEMTIHALEIMPDYLHLFLEFDPRWGVAEIVNRLKGYTSRVLREEFPHLRSRLPTLWSRSYFCSTVGTVSERTVRHYVDSQKGK
jgi:REP-associated tyrosine transposase